MTITPELHCLHVKLFSTADAPDWINLQMLGINKNHKNISINQENSHILNSTFSIDLTAGFKANKIKVTEEWYYCIKTLW